MRKPGRPLAEPSRDEKENTGTIKGGNEGNFKSVKEPDKDKESPSGHNPTQSHAEHSKVKLLAL